MAAPPPPLPTTKAPVKKKWAPVVAEQTLGKWSFDPSWSFNPATPAIDMRTDIPWSECIGVCEAEEGTGVFFVQFKSGTLVLKSSLTVGSDILAARLANMLGIDTPITKLMCYLANDWDTMVVKLWELEATNSIVGRGSKLAKCLLRPFLLLSEYTPGFHLANMPVNKAEEILGQKSILHCIGRIIAFDLFLNQWDRFPCGKVWSNNGNPKNIILTSPNNNWQLKAIDNNITSIDPVTRPDNFEQYKEKVHSAVSEVFSSQSETIPGKSVRDFIVLHAQYDIGESGSIEIQNGVKDEVRIISQFPIPEIAKLQSELDKQVKETLSLLDMAADHIGLPRVNMAYLENMHAVFSQFVVS